MFVVPKISNASDLKDAKYFKIQTSLFHRTFSLINFQKENFCLLKLSLNIFGLKFMQKLNLKLNFIQIARAQGKASC